MGNLSPLGSGMGSCLGRQIPRGGLLGREWSRRRRRASQGWGPFPLGIRHALRGEGCSQEGYVGEFHIERECGFHPEGPR